MQNMRQIFVAVALFISYQTLHAMAPIEHWQTDNGAQVYFVSTFDLPMVDVSVVFDAGSTRDGEKSGIATLTNGLLNEGAAGFTADQLAAQFADVGARFSNGASRDRATFSLRSLREAQYLQPALTTLASVLTQPDFPPDALERLRQQQIASLKFEQQRPSSIASRQFFKAIYNTHPYANPTGGTIETVAKLTRDEIKQFYQRYYVANNALIAIVGALTTAEAKVLANELLNQLPAGETAPNLPPAPKLTAPQTLNIAHPSTQTHIWLGQPGKSRHDPDYFPLYVGNHILGGSGLVSEIAQEVREQRGLAYSAYSFFMPMQEAGPFIASLQTQNAQKTEALTVLTDTLKHFVTHGVTAEQLDAAKKNLTGGFPLRIDSNSNILSYIAVIGFYQMPLDHLEKFNARIEAVTAEQIKAAFQRHIQLDKLVTVMVGGEVATENTDEPVSQ